MYRPVAPAGVVGQVREFVRQQSPTRRGLGREFSLVEGNRLTQRKGAGTERARGGGRISVRVNADAIETGAETGLHVFSDVGVERSPHPQRSRQAFISSGRGRRTQTTASGCSGPAGDAGIATAQTPSALAGHHPLGYSIRLDLLRV
jgi:hypothetical protein